MQELQSIIATFRNRQISNQPVAIEAYCSMAEAPIGMIILAAGASTRLGTPKQLLQYQGRSLLQHTAEVAIGSICNPIFIVLGAYADHIQPELKSLAVQIVFNSQWAMGMGTSLRTGISALVAEQPHLEAIVITVCDQPFISSQLINQLVEAYRSSGKLIVASAYAETLGVPALFDRTLFTELMSVEASIGAKQIIKQYSQETCCVPFSKGLIDIDTRKDYQQLIHQQ